MKPGRRNFTGPAFVCAMAQERRLPLLIHVRFQRRQAELILAPPDSQSLLLSELVRNDHLALLELRRSLSVSSLVTDQMRVGIQDRRTVSAHALDRRIAERRRSQHRHS